ncbi:MAG: IS66 family insertion sequence element accessory protein TnpB [Ruminococcus sp.]|nr:IS66 family insertion sequence element accessory protein TnpB [Ruminococcus sp.]
MQEKTKEIATIKQAVRLQQWAEQVQKQQASGLTIKQWCDENGIKTNTYYARLKRIREHSLGDLPAIVPLNIPQQQIQSEIHIGKNDLQISLPSDIDPDTLLALVKVLC